MLKRYIVLFIGLTFFLGGLSYAFCLNMTQPSASKCCAGKTPVKCSNTEDCLSHCAKQKVFAITGVSLSEESKAQKPHLVKSSPFFYLRTGPLNQNLEKTYYINLTDIKLNIGQIYFTPLFNHSPPLFP